MLRKLLFGSVILTFFGVFLFFSTSALASTTISSDITSDTTWTATAGPYILTSDITIITGATLTIQAGTVVKFNNYLIDLRVEGSVNAQGTGAQNIIFTEIRDDAGGDSNGDGSASSPGSGNWGHIEFAAGSTGVMDYVDIRYGGYPSLGQLTVNGGILTLTNSIIRHSSTHGVRIQNSDPVMTDNNWHDNASAARILSTGRQTTSPCPKE
ncbi:MAG: hypothetical protein B6I22_11945 [Desulfobacteraceae bacterium 4572_123]|nr:MAG: hypothetical protein B6I22_11945 [Desulfobacteraceae bacterium 4572_123]